MACPTLPQGPLFPSRQEVQGLGLVAVPLSNGSEQDGCCSGLSDYQLPVCPGIAVFSQSGVGGKGIVLDG